MNEEHYGGNEDVWVADGYGRYYVHRYDKSGSYIGSIDGGDGEAGAFDLPTPSVSTLASRRRSCT